MRRSRESMALKEAGEPPVPCATASSLLSRKGSASIADIRAVCCCGATMACGLSIRFLYGLALGIFALICSGTGQIRGVATAASQFDAGAFKAALVESSDYCNTLWSDRAFDPLRDKIPLMGGSPTPAMLANSQRVRPEDKPLAGLAMRTAEKCKTASSKAFAMLPATTQAKVRALQGKADALNKQLYDGKLTFGDYNIRRIELLTRMAVSLADFLEQPAEPAHVATTAQDHARAAHSMVSAQNTTPQSSQPHDLRIALVIGESRYLNLPKLINPESDARSIAETLQKMGYDTRLILDAPEDGIRKKFENLPATQAKPKLP
jgi:hypothetical protein